MHRILLFAAFVSMIAFSPVCAQENEEKTSDDRQATSIDPNPGKSLLELSQEKKRRDSADEMQSVIADSPQPEPREQTQPTDPERTPTNPERTPRFGTVLYEMADGVYVRSVYTNSPAQRIGLQTGDRLASINGQPLSESYDVYLILKELTPGDSISVEYRRNEEKLTREIALISHSELMRVSSTEYARDTRIAGTTGESQTVLRPIYLENATAEEIEQRIQLLEQQVKELRVRLEQIRRAESQTPTELEDPETEKTSNDSRQDPEKDPAKDPGKDNGKKEELSDPTEDGSV